MCIFLIKTKQTFEEEKIRKYWSKNNEDNEGSRK